MLEKIYAIVHAYQSTAPDMRLGAVIYFADHVRTTNYKDSQDSVTARLDVHSALLISHRQPLLVYDLVVDL